MKKKDQYFKVQADSEGEVANMYLYDFIGKEHYEEADKEKDTTDIAFVTKIRELEKSHRRINVRINSNGGFVKDGLAIMTAIRNSPAEVHTYNDGVAASMAFDIYMSAPYRHMATNATAMTHGSIGLCIGNSTDMRKKADVLDVMNEAASSALVSATKMTQKEVNERFYDGENHWFAYSKAVELGLVTEVGESEKYEAEKTASRREVTRSISKFFTNKKEEFQATIKSFVSDNKVQDAPKEDVLEIEKQATIFEMKNISEIVAAANAGTINKTDLIEQLTAEKSQDEKFNELLAAVKENNEQIKALGSQNAALEAQNAALTEKLGETPAAAATKVATAGDPVEPVQLDDFQQKLADENRRLRGK